MKFNFLKIIIIIFCSLCTQYTLAQTDDAATSTTSIETFLDSITVDLPEATLTCKAGGSLSEIFKKPTKFRSGGNAFFVDKVNNEIGLFEKAVFEGLNKDEKDTADIFIKMPGVTREDLVNLLLKKQLIVSQDAKIIFVVKIQTGTGVDTFIFDGKDIEGNKLGSTVFTRVRKVGTITFNNDKFFTADGFIKIRLPEPPKKINSDGTLSDVFRNQPGTLVCQCKGCPIHDFDLSDLQDAFDQGLVNDIIDEASR